MTRRKYWVKKILPFLTCAGLLLTSPVFAEAATQAERSAYQAVFDADYYRSAYPDVAAAFGNNKTALFNHFVNYGLKEGRSCSADFNPQAYRAKYTDLQQAFDNDMAAYCRHYVSYGKAEGRDGGGNVPAGTVTSNTAASGTVVTQGSSPHQWCCGTAGTVIFIQFHDFTAYCGKWICCSTNLYQWYGWYRNRRRCVPGIIDTLCCNAVCRTSGNTAVSTFPAGYISSGGI